MKKLLFLCTLLTVVACSKFDDSAIWNELNKHEDRIVKLETLCNQMNTNIASLQTIIIALQSNDYVVNIAPIKEGNKEIGYTITFSKSGSITIYHGKDGENGKDGVNGADGKDGQDGANGTDGKDGADGEDGYTPKIGVKQHTDGKYYWTLDGNWLLDDSGNMIPTTGEDGQDGVNGADGKDGVNGTNGKDGQDGKDGEDGQDGANGIDGKDGKDGITPQLKIEDGYWYLSYDNGATWQKLGKATGNNGLDGADGADGEDGDNIIDSITQDDDFVIFTLSDGKVFKIAKYNSDIIQFADYRVKMLCVSNWDTDNDFEISKAEAAAVESIGIVFKGDTDVFLFNELEYFTGLTEIEDEAFSQCNSLISVSIPDNVRTIGRKAFWKCGKLKNVSFGESSRLLAINGGAELSGAANSCRESVGAFAYCTSLGAITLPASLQVIGIGAFYGCSSLVSCEFAKGSALKAIESCDKLYNASPSYDFFSAFGAFSKTGLKSIKIPSSVTTLGPGAFSKSMLETVDFQPGIELEAIASVIGESGYNIHESCYYDGVFSDCVNLRSVTIPKSVVTIMPAAFKGCTSLEVLTFEDGSSLETIGGSFSTMNTCARDTSQGAFMNCSSLEKVIIPSTVTTLGVGAFENCINLKIIEFEGTSAIKYIKGDKCSHSGYGCPTYGGAFMNCKSLQEIKITTPTPPSLSEYAFIGVTTKNITLKVPYGSLEAYKAASYWKNMTIKEYYE